jgi:dihydroflavonol-4-reductase
MKALVVGATGFIGGAIARAAVERGWQVRATRRDCHKVGALGDLSEQGLVQWQDADLADVASLRRAMEGCDVVFHAAGYYPRTSRRAATQVRQARGQMENVLEAFRRARPQMLVYTSSLSTIGRPGEPDRLANEADVYQSGSVPVCYFDIKIGMEQAALASGLPVVALCPTSVFGPGDVKPTSGILLLAAARGQVFFYVDGVQDVVDVRDVATTHLSAVERARPGGRYIVGGETMTYREVLTTAARVAGRRPPWLRLPLGAVQAAGAVAGQLGMLGGDALQAIRYWQALDTSLARRELGHASRPFADTVRDTLIWFRQFGYL